MGVDARLEAVANNTSPNTVQKGEIVGTSLDSPTLCVRPIHESCDGTFAENRMKITGGDGGSRAVQSSEFLNSDKSIFGPAYALYPTAGSLMQHRTY